MAPYVLFVVGWMVTAVVGGAAWAWRSKSWQQMLGLSLAGLAASSAMWAFIIVDAIQAADEWGRTKGRPDLVTSIAQRFAMGSALWGAPGTLTPPIAIVLALVALPPFLRERRAGKGVKSERRGD